MQKVLTKTSVITSLSLSLVSAIHQVWANEESSVYNTNITNFNYPPHSCKAKPKKPLKPKKLVSIDEVDSYNAAITNYNLKVSDYNKIIKTYKSCINQYIKNGNHDINIIKEKLNSALKEARTTRK